MRRRCAPLIPLLSLLLGSCQLTTEAGPTVTEEGFSVRVASGALVLRNESAVPVHYVAIEERTAALVDLYFDASQWPAVAPGGQVRIPLAELMGYEPGAERAIVFWWTREQAGWRSLRVPLR